MVGEFHLPLGLSKPRISSKNPLGEGGEASATAIGVLGNGRTGIARVAASMKRPSLRRQRSAGNLVGRRIVVIAEPDPGDEIGGLADKPGVAMVLRRAGLAC